MAILLSVGGYTTGNRALTGAIGDAAIVQEKCTIDDSVYWLVKALDGSRYVISAYDTEDDGDSAHDIYIYSESFIRTGYLSGGDQIDIDELWSRLTNASEHAKTTTKGTGTFVGGVTICRWRLCVCGVLAACRGRHAGFSTRTAFHGTPPKG